MNQLEKRKIIWNIATKRGLIWQSAEIYNLPAGFYDYGPIGCLLKNNLINFWRDMFIKKDGLFEIDTPTIVPEIIFKASGHLDKFFDPLIQCKKCNSHFRADHIIQETLNRNVEGISLEELDKIISKENITCPKCGGRFKDAQEFNLMFKTTIGPLSTSIGYSRPETAQGIFVNFYNVQRAMRSKLPFGIAQIGRAYRNEISPRRGLIRVRELTLAEIEYFVDYSEINKFPKFEKHKNEILRLLPIENQKNGGKIIEISALESVEKGIVHNKILAYYLVMVKKYLLSIGIPWTKIRFRQQLPSERAHYSADTWDIEVNTSYGWIEVAGHAYRTDYDLTRHSQYSGKSLSYFKKVEKSGSKLDLQLNAKKLGPRLKELTKKVVEFFRNIDENKKSELAKTLKKNGCFEVEVEGKKIKLTEDEVAIIHRKTPITGERIIPHVIEPSYGVDRIFWCILESCLVVESDRTFFRFPYHIAPIQVAVFPLLKKDALVKSAKKLTDLLMQDFYVQYDESGSIGRRYARSDEVGVPIAITVDYTTLSDNTVTLRDRDSKKQIRLKIPEIKGYIHKMLHNTSAGKFPIS